MIEIIKSLINQRSDRPCLIISGYDNKNQPKKPYCAMYLINHNTPDIYMSDEEIKSEESVLEKMKYWGEFTIQFDVLGTTEIEAFKTAKKLQELITYKMRYSDFEPNMIGIINEDYQLKALHEEADSKEYIYRYSFDITFESEITVERVTEIAKDIEITLNNKKYNLGGK